jgi:MFS transporter, SP family, galactose:H+ symporter
VFLSLIEAMKAYSFLVFSAVSLAGAAYVWRLLPETKGKSLVEIQLALQR